MKYLYFIFVQCVLRKTDLPFTNCMRCDNGRWRDERKFNDKQIFVYAQRLITTNVSWANIFLCALRTQADYERLSVAEWIANLRIKAAQLGITAKIRSRVVVLWVFPRCYEVLKNLGKCTKLYNLGRLMLIPVGVCQSSYSWHFLSITATWKIILQSYACIVSCAVLD